MIFGTFELTKRSNGVLVAKDSATGLSAAISPTDSNYSAWLYLYKDVVATKGDTARADKFSDFLAALAVTPSPTDKEEVKEKTLTPEERLKRGVSNIMSFFKEFSFEPSFRFMNTLAFKIKEGKKEAKEYILNYFSLMDNQFTGEVKGKLKSVEFEGILDDISAYDAPTKVINSRLSIYYGSAGTGKTTIGMKEADNRCIVCNSSMLPSDLMEDFVFKDGKPTFQKSALWESMEQGKAIVFDEINLLPYDSLRFLQGILDGKTEVDYKGNIITIKEGFKVIGTMNLSLGGMVYGLPEPLVDRCSDIQEFKLNASQLMKAITG